MSESIPFSDLFGLDAAVTHLGIVGSREWPDRAFVHTKIREALERWPQVTHLVSGGQPEGVDGWAKEFAKEHGLGYVEYAPAHMLPKTDPRYHTYHVTNFFNRNSLIANNVDALLAFCFDKSGGTLDTHQKATSKLASEYVRLYTEAHLL